MTLQFVTENGQALVQSENDQNYDWTCAGRLGTPNLDPSSLIDEQ